MHAATYKHGMYHMRDTFNAGYILCVDEIMSIWYGLDQQGSDVYVFQRQ